MEIFSSTKISEFGNLYEEQERDAEDVDIFNCMDFLLSITVGKDYE